MTARSSESETCRRAGRAFACFFAIVASAAAFKAFAQGITDTRVTIGQTIALSGSVGEHGKAITLGAQAYLDRINRAGGVHGRKIVLVTVDDAGSSRRAEENARKLVAEQRVLALFSGAEGGPCVAATTVGGELRVPVVGCAGGSPDLREPFNPYSFPIRAAHFEEFEKLLEHAATYGLRRFAFVHADSGNGRKHLANVRRLVTRHGGEVALAVPLPSNSSAVDAARIAEQIDQAGVQAVLNHGSYGHYAAIILAARKRGSPVQFLAVNSGVQQMMRLLDRDAAGLVFTQVVPFPWYLSAPIVREYRAALKSHAPRTEPTFSSLEGYINARVLVEALNRAGRKLTRERFMAALESIDGYDVGGLVVSYASNNHQGSTYVDLVVVGSQGTFVR